MQYLVSKHPEVEAKLCEELRGLSLLATPESPTPRQVAFEDIGRMPYLTAVVKVRAGTSHRLPSGPGVRGQHASC